MENLINDFFDAIKKQDLKRVSALIVTDPSLVNAPAPTPFARKQNIYVKPAQSALEYSCQFGSEKIAKILLDNGANVSGYPIFNLYDQQVRQHDPLWYAACNSMGEVANQLISKGVKVEDYHKDMVTQLMQKRLMDEKPYNLMKDNIFGQDAPNFKPQEIHELLSERHEKNKVSLVFNNDESLKSDKPRPVAITDHEISKHRYILPDKNSFNNQTLLPISEDKQRLVNQFFDAITKQDALKVEALLNKDQSIINAPMPSHLAPRYENWLSRSALEYSMDFQFGSTEIPKLLLKHNADLSAYPMVNVNNKEARNHDPLYFAIRGGSPEMVNRLVSHGVSPEEHHKAELLYRHAAGKIDDQDFFEMKKNIFGKGIPSYQINQADILKSEFDKASKNENFDQCIHIKEVQLPKLHLDQKEFFEYIARDENLDLSTRLFAAAVFEKHPIEAYNNREEHHVNFTDKFDGAINSGKTVSEVFLNSQDIMSKNNELGNSHSLLNRLEERFLDGEVSKQFYNEWKTTIESKVEQDNASRFVIENKYQNYLKEKGTSFEKDAELSFSKIEKSNDSKEKTSLSKSNHQAAGIEIKPEKKRNPGMSL